MDSIAWPRKGRRLCQRRKIATARAIERVADPEPLPGTKALPRNQTIRDWQRCEPFLFQVCVVNVPWSA